MGNNFKLAIGYRKTGTGTGSQIGHKPNNRRTMDRKPDMTAAGSSENRPGTSCRMGMENLSRKSNVLNCLSLQTFPIFLYFLLFPKGWDHFGVTLESLWVHFWSTLGSTQARFGVALGSPQGHVGMILGQLWDHALGHFGITLRSLAHVKNLNQRAGPASRIPDTGRVTRSRSWNRSQIPTTGWLTEN